MNLLNNELYLSSVAKVTNDKNLNFSKLKNKKILITGASGLIGSYLVDVLMYRNKEYNDNIQIYMLCRNENKLKSRFNYYQIEKLDKNNKGNLIYIIQDVCNKFEFDISFDYIIHSASNTHPKQYATDPVGTITTNVIGLNNILSYCVDNKVERILMMSSVEIYGENKGDIDKFNESYLGYIDCNTTRAGYPESKRLGESLCQSYISQYGLDIVISRLSRVYGPTMLEDDSKALAQFIKNAIHGEDIVLKSEGSQFFSYTYVADAVSAILKILFDGKKGEAYNIADDASNITLKDLAKILANFNNKDVVFQLPNEIEKKGYSTATKAILDDGKIKELGWEPYYTIESGLIETLKIMKK